MLQICALPSTRSSSVPAACACVLQAALAAAKNDKASMNRALKKAEALLRDMVSMTLRTDLTRIQRTNLETVITVHMHQKESTGAGDSSQHAAASPCGTCYCQAKGG